MKLNLGCGRDIRAGYLNVDAAPLPGVDLIHYLSKFPWPLQSNYFEEIQAVHILEHLPDTGQVMSEIWRIARDGCMVNITVPIWNSEDAVTDPTHIKFFTPKTFDFFDHRTESYAKRNYYFPSKFEIEDKKYTFKIGNRYYPIPLGFLSILAEVLSLYIGNVIQVLNIRMIAIKGAPSNEAYKRTKKSESKGIHVVSRLLDSRNDQI